MYCVNSHILAHKILEALLTEEELTCAFKALAKGKSPCPDKFTIYFFKAHGSFMSVGFTTKVTKFLAHSWFPKGVMHGLIALLFKEEIGSK